MQTRVGGPLFSRIHAHVTLATWFVLLFSFLLTDSLLYRYRGPPLVGKPRGGVVPLFLHDAAPFPLNRVAQRCSCLVTSFFLFSFSFADHSLLSDPLPAPSSRFGFATRHPLFTCRPRPVVSPSPPLASCIALALIPSPSPLPCRPHHLSSIASPLSRVTFAMCPPPLCHVSLLYLASPSSHCVPDLWGK